jgi:hypothetical protein
MPSDTIRGGVGMLKARASNRAGRRRAGALSAKRESAAWRSISSPRSQRR